MRREFKLGSQVLFTDTLTSIVPTVGADVCIRQVLYLVHEVEHIDDSLVVYLRLPEVVS